MTYQCLSIEPTCGEFVESTEDKRLILDDEVDPDKKPVEDEEDDAEDLDKDDLDNDEEDDEDDDKDEEEEEEPPITS